MVFIDYEALTVFAIPISVILLGVWGYFAVRRKGSSLSWLLVRIASVGISSLGCFLLLLIGCAHAVTDTINSAPIYSADHKHAVRVSDFDYGAVGGDTSVILFSSHGFSNRTVLAGGWKIVEAQDIHWTANSELLVEYPTDTGYDPPVCNSFADIKVTCRPTDRRTWHH